MYVEASAYLTGTTSLNLLFTEPVLTAPSHYTNILVDGAGNLTSSEISCDGSSTIRVQWNDTSSANALSEIRFTIQDNLITDLAGNPISNPGLKQISGAANESEVLIPDLSDKNLDGDDVIQLCLSFDNLIQQINTPINTIPLLDVTAFDNATSLTTGTGTVNGATSNTNVDNDAIVFPTDQIIVNSRDGAIEFEPSVRIDGFPNPQAKQITIDSYDTENLVLGEEFMQAHPNLDVSSINIVEFGDPNATLTFDIPIKITIPNLQDTVFTINSIGNMKEILSCDESVTDSMTAMVFIDTIGDSASLIDGGACYVDNDIWTVHFTGFGSGGSSSSGDGDCGECTPPTLGYNSQGRKIVSNGFSYNGNPSDVQYFFTPYPLIVTEVGKENVAVFKMYDNEGPSKIMHFSMAFGLRTGEVISESKVAIEYDIDPQNGNTTIITDPKNVIDNDTVRIETDVVQCIAGGTHKCLEISIYHTFRAPLDFDIVASDVWDTRRNAWQNYYNHGIHIEGESLNPVAGTLVNDDTLRLYPLIANSTHVQVMVDEDYNLFVLTPDGYYLPLRNTYSLFHEIDESMYSSGVIPDQGIDRNDPRFKEHLLSQIDLAQTMLDEILSGQQITNDEFFDLSNGIDGNALRSDQARTQKAADDAELQNAIKYEQSKAELLFELFFNIRDDQD